jgi:hypothetical protein
MARDYVSMLGSPQGGLIGNLMRGVQQGHATQVARHKARVDRAQLDLQAAALKLKRATASQDYTLGIKKLTAQKQMAADELETKRDIAAAELRMRYMQNQKENQQADARLAIQYGNLERQRADDLLDAEYQDKVIGLREEELGLKERRATETQLSNLEKERIARGRLEQTGKVADARADMYGARSRYLGSGGSSRGRGISGAGIKSIGEIFGSTFSENNNSVQFFSEPTRGANPKIKAKAALGKGLTRAVEVHIEKIKQMYNDPELNDGEVFNETEVKMAVIQKVLEEMKTRGIFDEKKKIDEDALREYIQELYTR